MNRAYIFTVASLLISTVLSSAYADVSANVTLVSDRLLRGFSLTDEEPSLYGGIHYKHDNSGLYADAVVFTNIQIHDENELQLDAVAGYKLGSDTFKVDIGYVHHAFSEFSEGDSGEVFVGGIVKNFSGHFYKNTEFEETYIDLNAHFKVGNHYNIAVHAGMLDSDDNDAKDFNDYSVQVNRNFDSIGGINIGLALSHNDNDGVLEELAGSRAVLSVSKTWK